MNTKHPREALSAYLDGELSAEERGRLEEHLRHCAQCTSLLADLELLARAGAEEEVPPAPADLSARIMAHIPRGVAERRRHWIHRMPLAAAASLAAAALLWVVFQDAPPPVPDPEFGRDMVSRQAPPGPPEEQQPEQGAAGDAGNAAEAEEVLRQEAKKGELNEAAETPPPQAAPQRFAYAPSDHDGAAAGKKDAAPAAPPVPAERKPRSKPVDRADRALQEKQRLVGRSEPIRPPAGSSRERALAMEAASESTREADKVAALPSTATALNSVAKQNVLAESSLDSVDVAPAPRPTLVLHEAGQEIRLTDTGLLTVNAPEYHCTILLPGADHSGSATGKRSVGMLVADSRVQPVDDEILSLFQEGVVGVETEDGKQPLQRAQARSVGGLLELPTWTVMLEDAEGAQPLESDARAAGIRSRLQSLVRERYRPRLEAQCGPLPQPVEDADQKP
jgi:hypothetical protein